MQLPSSSANKTMSSVQNAINKRDGTPTMFISGSDMVDWLTLLNGS